MRIFLLGLLLPGLLLLLLGLVVVACDTPFGIGDSGFSIGFDTSRGCDTSSSSEEKRYADVDGDGFGDADAALFACLAPAEFVADATDCNDGAATVNPDATDLCGDSIDQDCDGIDPACDTAA